MKTRLETLETMHDEGLMAIMDCEFSIKLLSRMIITATEDNTKVNAQLISFTEKKKNLERNVSLIEEMMKEEAKKDYGVAIVK